jgi:integrase
LIAGLLSEIDFEKRMITLPATRTKNHSEHIVPLTDKALAILQAIPGATANMSSASGGPDMPGGRTRRLRSMRT